MKDSLNLRTSKVDSGPFRVKIDYSIKTSRWLRAETQEKKFEVSLLSVFPF